MDSFVQKVSNGMDKVPKLARQFYSSVIASFSSTNGEMTPPLPSFHQDTTRVTQMSEWKSNPRDKALLRETWSDDFSQLYTLGADIYLSYETEGRDFTEGKEFRSQSLRFVQTIAHVVKNVYHMERLEGFLYDIGQRHIKYASRGFKPQYWDLFQDAMQAALTNRMNSLPEISNEDRERVIMIWRDIALYIIDHMKKGYYDGLNGINQFPSGIIM